MSVQPAEKVYVEILKKIKSIIQEDKLMPGDKLPSERELTERLNVGRSSVREALRSLELLGLIETRRGEGTFIREATGHRLVEVLASFILNDRKAKQDLAETRNMVIKDCVQLACSRITNEELERLDKLASMAESVSSENQQEASRLTQRFEKLFIQSCRNHLLYRLYLELTGYETSILSERVHWSSELCLNIVRALKDRNCHAVLHVLIP